MKAHLFRRMRMNHHPPTRPLDKYRNPSISSNGPLDKYRTPQSLPTRPLDKYRNPHYFPTRPLDKYRNPHYFPTELSINIEVYKFPTFEPPQPLESSDYSLPEEFISVESPKSPKFALSISIETLISGKMALSINIETAPSGKTEVSISIEPAEMLRLQ
jgi:hypothetical protein